jgi:serine phosphatase RsbU (regulator of sigma subunit)
MTMTMGPLPRAVLVAAGAYALATAFEFALIAIFHPTEWALTWVSDAVLASAVGVSTYLWQHLRDTRAALSSAERARLVLDTQLTLAADLQRSQLPTLPEDRPSLQWGATLRPAGRIGGDFYDVVPAPTGDVMFVLADIAGKGIPAAMLLAYTRAVFRTLVQEHRQPRDLAARLSGALFADTGGQSYLTCIVGRLDVAQRVLTAVNAGHPPALIVRDDGVVRLQPGGPPAGLFPDSAYEDQVVELQPGDRAVFVTDGVTEALEQVDGSPSEAIVAIVRAMPDGTSAGAICDAVVTRAVNSPGPAGVADWEDDRTVLAFSVGARPAA